MSQLYSLSGYLTLKARRAFKMGRTNRRLWFVYIESNCLLESYLNEQDFISNRSLVLNKIDISRAAIMIDPDEEFQFNILSNSKNYTLKAENQQSYLVWIEELQKKRDAYNKCHLIMITEQYSLDSHELIDDMSLLRRSKQIYSSLNKKKISLTDDLKICIASSNSSLAASFVASTTSSSEEAGITSSSESEISFKDVTIKTSKEMTSKKTNNKSLENICESNKYKNRRAKSIFYNKASQEKYTTLTNYFSNKFAGRKANLESLRKEISINDAAKVSSLQLHNRLEFNSVASNDSAFYDTNEMKSLRNEIKFSSLHANDNFDQKTNFLSRNDLRLELLKLKCQLASFMDREEMLEKKLREKDALIDNLNEKILDIEICSNQKLKAKKLNLIYKDKFIEHKVEADFLRTELKNMHAIVEADENKLKELSNLSKILKDQLNSFRKEYVSVLQSFLRITIDQTNAGHSEKKGSLGKNSNIYYDTQQIENMYFTLLMGGDNHKDCLKDLLEECRKVDPKLPSWNALMEDDCYVDIYGFKSPKKSEADTLHYTCQLLKTFYSNQPNSLEDSIWDLKIKEWKKSFVITKELKQLVRQGIQPNYRGKIWSIIINHQIRAIKESKGPNYYLYLCNLASKSSDVIKFTKQINLDLLRTMPNNIKFSGLYSEGIINLREVLQAFCVHNPSIGYCQGMNFIVGVALLFLEPEDAFWLLVAVTEKYFLKNYFDSGLVGAQVDQKVLKDLIKLKLPELYDHLEALEIDISSITLNWFLALFIDSVPFDTLLRVWDTFLLEGSKVLFRYSCAFLSIYQKILIEQTDTISIFKQLKLATRLTYDVEGLTKVAYIDMKPFPSRNEINTKQTYYNKIFTESWKKKEADRSKFIQHDKLELNDENNLNLILECACFIRKDEFWITYGDQYSAEIIQGSLKTGTMSKLELDTKIDSKAICMLYILDFNIVVIALLCGYLIGFDIEKKCTLWRIKLVDSIMSMIVHKNESDNINRIYCGLSNGSIVVLEVYSQEEPTDIFEVKLSQSPINCIEIVKMNNEYTFWIASANLIYILNEKLNQITKIQVTQSQFDIILAIKSSSYGVYLSIRGSSLLHLYDSSNVKNMLLFDTNDNKIKPNNPDKDESFGYCSSRITCFLVLHDYVFIGTGNGYLNIYSIKLTNRIAESLPKNLNKSLDKMADYFSPTKSLNKMDGKYFILNKAESNLSLCQHSYDKENNHSSSYKHPELRRFKSDFSIDKYMKENSFINNLALSAEKSKFGWKKRDKISVDSESSSDNTNSSDWYSADSFMPQMCNKMNKASSFAKQNSLDNHVDSKDPFLLIKKYLTDLDRINKLCNEENFRDSNYSTPVLNWSKNLSDTIPQSNLLVHKCLDLDKINLKNTPDQLDKAKKFLTKVANDLENSISWSKRFLKNRITSDLGKSTVSLFSEISQKKIQRTKQFLNDIENEDSKIPNLDVFLDDIINFNNQIKELNEKFKQPTETVLDTNNECFSLSNNEYNTHDLWDETYIENETSDMLLIETDNLETVKNSLESISSESSDLNSNKTIFNKNEINFVKKAEIFSETSSTSTPSSTTTSTTTSTSTSTSISTQSSELSKRSSLTSSNRISSVESDFEDLENTLKQMNKALSFSSDVECNFSLVSRAKISDKPVRSIIQKKTDKDDIIISCSGNYGDDESVLVWTQSDNQSWKNAPVIEWCTETKRPIRPLYAKIEFMQKKKKLIN